MAAPRRDSRRKSQATSSPRFMSLLSGLFSSREIEKRVEENFPSWEEFSQEKITAADEHEEQSLDLPPHRIYISSPLINNFLYLVVISGAIALGFSVPEQAPYLIYGAIVVVALIALFVIFRDGVFFHLEAMRLRADADMINKHTKGPGADKNKERFGFLKSLVRQKNAVFRSKLLQIHYQNILRTFEQGNRRAWVSQDASIADIQTLLSQRGMKVVWTLIEVLPQMGLIGTLIGLSTMFFAFNSAAELPEVAIIAGFGTALGTTILANLFVLLLRPLFMQNERAMNETLSTLQMLMAVFILPTQQSVFDRNFAATLHAAPVSAPSVPTNFNEDRLSNSMEELTSALAGFTEARQDMESGALARDTAVVAGDVRAILKAMSEAVQPAKIAHHDDASSQLTKAMRELTQSLNRSVLDPENPPAGQSPRMEHDLTQLRVLTHDTLVLLEHIAGQMDRMTDSKPNLLSANETVRQSVLSNDEAGTQNSGGGPESGEIADPPDGEDRPRIRLFEEGR